MNERRGKILNILMFVGANTSKGTVEAVDELLSFIPTRYLKHFGEYVLKNYNQYKKPLVNIATSSQEYKRQLYAVMVKKGEMRFDSANEVQRHLQEFYKGKEVANCVSGIYKDFVTISLNEKGEFINDYSHKKLTSADKNRFIFWCFKNQHRIGDVKLIEPSKVEKAMLELEQHKEAKQISYEVSNPKVSTMIKNVLEAKR